MPLDNKFHQTPKLERNLLDCPGESAQKGSQKSTFDFIRYSKSEAQDDNSFLTSLEKKRLMQYPIEIRSKDDNQALTRLQQLRLEHMGYLKESPDHSDSLSQAGTEVSKEDVYTLHADSLSQAGTEIGDEGSNIPSSTGKAFSKEDFINDFLNRLQNPEKDVEGVVQELAEGQRRNNSLEANALTDLETEMAIYYSRVDGDVYTWYIEYNQRDTDCNAYAQLRREAQTLYDQWWTHYEGRGYTGADLTERLEYYQAGIDRAVAQLGIHEQGRVAAEDALRAAINRRRDIDVDTYSRSSADVRRIFQTYHTAAEAVEASQTTWLNARNQAEQARTLWRGQRYTEQQIHAALEGNGYTRAIRTANHTLVRWTHRHIELEEPLFRAIQRARQAGQ
ncbi:hypothetical protein KSF_081470 [Reticulibacter mediterranei]|uniref:Uncharacterized protein n=1 Tax=Reticulibacter mediterranei TaxID=2778369 RepID=A0A8J3IM59_9CHLR|nr:hypothetical protein [Reticulibacter mediterranei]GHO98099.1 hypothetical protein KSF_081470 [Reticulibacter mediterranei]